MLANRKIVLALVLLAVTAVFSTASSSTKYGNRPGKGAAPANFVGSYYTSLEGATTGGAVTFHSDGTVSSTLADMFEFTGQRQNRRSSPSLGVWRKVANNQIRVTTTFFFSGSPTPEDPDGLYSVDGLVVKVTYLAEFDKNKKGVSPGYVSRDLEAKIYTPSQNPNTDTPISIVELPDGGIGYRMMAE